MITSYSIRLPRRVAKMEIDPSDPRAVLAHLTFEPDGSGFGDEAEFQAWLDDIIVEWLPDGRPFVVKDAATGLRMAFHGETGVIHRGLPPWQTKK